MIWLELNSEFDLNLYLINPGDQIFVPVSLFPIKPVKKHLSRSLVWAQILVTKQTTRSKTGDCNDTVDYVYGGKMTVNFEIIIQLR